MNTTELLEFTRDETLDPVKTVADIEVDWAIKFGFSATALGFSGVTAVVETPSGKEISVWVKLWGITVWGGDEFVPAQSRSWINIWAEDTGVGIIPKTTGSGIVGKTLVVGEVSFSAGVEIVVDLVK